MRKNIIKSLATITVFAILLSVTFITSSIKVLGAPAAQAKSGGNVSSGPTRIEKVSDAVAYWTPERIASAKPMPLMEVKGTGKGVSLSAAAAASANLHPGFAPGNAPSQPPAAAIQLDAFMQPVTAVSNYYTYPFPYTYSYIGGGFQKQFPENTNGKLFFSQDGGNWVCSGTVVTDNGAEVNRLVATAGHCVNDGLNRDKER